jgi:hypothetical protein
MYPNTIRLPGHNCRVKHFNGLRRVSVGGAAR